MKHFQHPAGPAFFKCQHRLHQTSPLERLFLAAANANLLVTAAPARSARCPPSLWLGCRDPPARPSQSKRARRRRRRRSSLLWITSFHRRGRGRRQGSPGRQTPKVRPSARPSRFDAVMVTTGRWPHQMPCSAPRDASHWTAAPSDFPPYDSPLRFPFCGAFT